MVSTTTWVIVVTTLAVLSVLGAAVVIQFSRTRKPRKAIEPAKGEEAQTPAGWYPERRKVGNASRNAGFAFAGITAGFLVLAYITQSIIIEIDSLVSFLAAAVLLLSDPKQRVEASVLDAVLSSSNSALADFEASRETSFVYTQKGSGVAGVVASLQLSPDSSGSAAGRNSMEVTPPGRALANLFTREAGIAKPTLESIEASLSVTLREELGLSDSASFRREGDSVTVTLSRPSFECGCRSGPARSGVLGCTIGSFLAVLACAAAEAPVTLSSCSRDLDKDTWAVSMSIGRRT